MSGFILLITDRTALHHEITCHTRGARVVTRSPESVTRREWTDADLVWIDAHAAPSLRHRVASWSAPNTTTLLLDAADRPEPDILRHALGLGARTVVTLPDGAGHLRRQATQLTEFMAVLVVILDPTPGAEIGTVTTASLALAATAAGERTSVIDARGGTLDLHRTLTGAVLDSPASARGTLRVLSTPGTEPPPAEELRGLVGDLTGQHTLTLVHANPYEPVTWHLLHSADLALIPVAAERSGLAARGVIELSTSRANNTHVHLIGDADTDLAEALTALCGTSSITGHLSALPADDPDQVNDPAHRSALWDAVARSRARPTHRR
ncbi:hypothetical protein GIY23_12910 [Allosaccharopolyspora coralli]|uniref:Rv3660c-like CheY-like N-terminal domain-containing protein n=1 Tax=Allosaccharopolyspora coralli TaxID=2665642 RepID=A0A5Q3QFJ7_9PSEU|nr:hypothetical protein [Allosaccharopolyspora coralli]QGK70305.1 hypothetical protein GIY23_12910 [Allosaccharopolyspora coralli]